MADHHKGNGDKLQTMEDEIKRLRKAGDWLAVCAQTTGGTAGRDDGLVAAVQGWVEAKGEDYDGLLYQRQNAPLEDSGQ